MVDCITLFVDSYVLVELCEKGSLVRIVRTALMHPDMATLRSSFAEVNKALDRSGRLARAMLFDTRAPVGRNDPMFEKEMSALRPFIDRGFLRIAVLVHSAVGALQIRRWVSEDGIERAVGTDEQSLLEFLKNIPSQKSDKRKR